MNNVLVFIQHEDGLLLKSTLTAISAAKELKDKWSKGKVLGLCLGPQAAEAAKATQAYGLDAIYYLENQFLNHYLAIPYAQVLAHAVKDKDCDTVIAAATSMAKDFMPRLAVLLEAGQASDVIAVNEEGSLKRPMYAGDVIAEVEICTQNKVITTRSTAFSPAKQQAGSAVLEELKVQIDTNNIGEHVAYELSNPAGPDLRDADVVIGGGRGLQSLGNFKEQVLSLADCLGAAVGASRAAVDMGYAPNDWQVGQTGKMIAPKLYIAIGISGSIQHIAGIKDSKVIVAINSDAEAPIFEIADFGIVADLNEVVPKLVQAINEIETTDL